MGRILVIDDEPSTRVLFKSRLEDLGHRVTLAANGAEGLMMARSNEFDLFLVDIGLGSGVDGFEVCRRLKAVPQTNGVPVVLISGQSTTREDLHRGYNAGCESFLMKGNMTLLEDVLRAMLRIKSLKDDLAVQNYLLERQNQRLQEEMRTRPAGGDSGDVQRGPERPLGMLLVAQDGQVLNADRGARDLFGAGLEGRSLGQLAPSRGLEAFVRDARIEPRSGFRLDLPARGGRASRSLLVSVVPTMPRGGSDLGSLKAVWFHDASNAGAGVVASPDTTYDLPLVEAARRVYRPSAILGSSLHAVQCREAIQRAKEGQGPVLVSGEEGTGKTFLARTLHFAGARSGRFLHLDAGSVSADVIESELFGDAKHQGLVRAADQGTLYVSNVDALPSTVQLAFVRLVERGEVELGGATERVDVRLVVSSRWSLADLEAGGHLEAALLALLGQHNVQVAPLRERFEDLAPLAQHMARYVSGGSVRLSSEDLVSLEQHDWPRNLRELEDCVEVLCATALGDDSGIGVLPEALRDRAGAEAGRDRLPGEGHGELRPVPRMQAPAGHVAPLEEPVSLDLYERMALERALEESGGDKLAAARLLKVGKSTLYRKLKRHGIS